MWKAFSRSVCEVVERRVGLTVFRSDATNSNAVDGTEKTSKCRRVSCLVPKLNNFCPLKLIKASSENTSKEQNEEKRQENKHHDRGWGEAHNDNNTWLGAMGWSSALVLGWYLSQPVCFHRLFGDAHSRRRRLYESNRCGFSRAFITDALAQSPIQPLKIQPLNTSLGAAERTNNRTGSTSSCVSTNSSSCGSGSSNDTVVSSNDLAVTCENSDDLFIQRGPFTPEEALNEASRVFAAASRSLVGDVENKLGMVCMEKGEHSKALKHFRRASRHDNSNAAYNIGQCYELGLGTSSNLKKAAKWYKIASDRGHSTAMYNLAVFFAHGLGGLSEDKERARALLTTASSLGLKQAEDALNSILLLTNLSETNASQKSSELNSTDEFLDLLGVRQEGEESHSKSEFYKKVESDVHSNYSHLNWLDLPSSSPSSIESFPSSFKPQFYSGLSLENSWSVPRDLSDVAMDYSQAAINTNTGSCNLSSSYGSGSIYWTTPSHQLPVEHVNCLGEIQIASTI